MIAIHPYATHLPALIGCVAATDGRVLELGSGVFSTPVLHAACARRELVTADSDPEWMQRFLYLEGGTHRFELVRDWSRWPLIDEPWDVALVDQSPGHARAPSIERLRRATRLIVVHDTNEVDHYRFEPLLSTFRHRHDFLELGTPVRTTVVSDHMPIPFSMPPVTAHHTKVQLATETVRVQTSALRWAGHELRWPSDAGHFFLAGEIEIEVPSDDLHVQAVFLGEQGRELFWMNLVPGAVRETRGEFCLAQEAAQPVPVAQGGPQGPAWADVRSLLIRIKATQGAVSVNGLHLLALSRAERSIV